MATRLFYQNMINALVAEFLNNISKICLSPISYQDKVLSIMYYNIDNFFIQLIKYFKLTRVTLKKILNQDHARHQNFIATRILNNGFIQNQTH